MIGDRRRPFFSRLNWCAPALAVCFAITVAAAQAQPGGGPNVQVRTVEVRDVAFGKPGVSELKIARMVFTGFVRSGERVRAERIDLENIVAQAGTRAMEIPALVISGADLPMPLFRALTEGADADDWAGLLTQASMDQISIEQIVQRDPSMNFEGTLKGLAVNGLKAGVVASARFGSATASAADDGDKILMQLGEVRYQGIDIGETVRFATGGGNGRSKRLLQRVVADGMDIAVGDTAMHLDRFEMSGVDGAAPMQALPVELGLDAMIEQAGSDPKLRQQVATYFTEALRQLRINRYSLEGLTVTVPQEPKFSLGAMSISGLSSRGIDRIEVTGVDFPVPDTPVQFDRFELEKITYGALLDVALSAAASGQEPDLAPANLAGIVPRIGGIRLAGLKMGTPQGPISLADLRIEIDDFTGALPERFAAAVNGLKVDLASMEPSDGRDKLIALGFGEVSASAQAQLRWLPRERALVIENTGVTIEKAGQVDISVRLDNVDFAGVLADPNAAERVLGEARIGSVQVRLANLGLAESFYADVAKSARISPAAVRAGLAAEMSAQASSNFGPLFAPGSAEAIARFLQSPGRIIASIAPRAGQPPITVADVKGVPPPALMERITIKLEAAPN